MKNKLLFGSHIRVKVDSFYHHGIYVSDNEVIHFCSEGKFSILSKSLEIQSTNLDVFAQGNEIEIVEHQKRFSRRKTVKIAHSKIGIKDYDLIFNNCEHFASFCATGVKQCKIIDNLKKERITIKRKNGINGLLDSIYQIITI